MIVLSFDIGKKNLGWCVRSTDSIQFGRGPEEKEHAHRRGMSNGLKTINYISLKKRLLKQN